MGGGCLKRTGYNAEVAVGAGTCERLLQFVVQSASGDDDAAVSCYLAAR